MDASDIRNIAEDVLRNGTETAYKSGKSKVMSVTFNGVTKTVQIPYAIDANNVMHVSSGWIVD